MKSILVIAHPTGCVRARPKASFAKPGLPAGNVPYGLPAAAPAEHAQGIRAMDTW